MNARSPSTGNHGMLALDAERRVVGWSLGAEQILGYRDTEILGRPADTFFTAEDRAAGHPLREWETALRDGYAIAERWQVRRDGSRFWASNVLIRLPGNPGAAGTPSFLRILWDQTALHHAEAARREAEERFRLLVQSVQDYAIFLLDPEGRVTHWNEGAARVKGYEATDVLGRHVALFYPPEQVAAGMPERQFEEAIAYGRSRQENWRVRKGGEQFWAEELVVPLRDEGDGRLLGFATICRDLSERKAAQDELQRREARFRSLIEHTSDLITVINQEGVVRFQSPSSERVLGHPPEALLGRNAFEWVHPDDEMRVRVSVQKALEAPSVMTPVEYRFRHANGAWRVLQSLGRKIPEEASECLLVVHSRDVTAQKELEIQLRQSQKMDAIGQLAGGLAHDFNNLLAVILGHSERLARELPPEIPLRDSVTEIWRASKRAASLTQKLLAFSRQQVLEPKVVDLNVIVTDAETLLRRLIGEDVRLVTALQPDLAPVRVDPGQVEQVILNLAVNARDAMPQGGTLLLETRNVEGEPAAGTEGLPSRHVLLTVCDTGCGMAPEVQARIFEPFFTTKGEGKGTGLGLAVAHGIIEQSGGHVSVRSQPGVGTTFDVYLPAAEGPVTQAVQTVPAIPAPGNGELILLVEDEESVRTITGLLLKTLGYRVLQAASGEEALRLARRHRREIDLLMTDVVMPGMSGRDLADALQAKVPRVKVLFYSGYTPDAVVRRGVVQAETAFLQKPFTPQALARKLRELLDAP